MSDYEQPNEHSSLLNKAHADAERMERGMQAVPVQVRRSLRQYSFSMPVSGPIYFLTSPSFLTFVSHV